MFTFSFSLDVERSKRKFYLFHPLLGKKTEGMHTGLILVNGGKPELIVLIKQNAFRLSNYGKLSARLN